MAKFLLGVALVLSANFSFAQSWTLEKCIEAAIQNNLSVQRTDLNIKLAEHTYLNQKGQFLPTINGFLQTDLNFGRTIDPFTNTFATDEVRSDAYGIQANWVLFNGMQRYNQYKQGQYDIMASKYDADKTKNDISLAVSNAFLQIVFNKELLRVADEQVKLTESQVKRTKKLVDAGSLPMGNLMDIQAQLAREELNQVTVTNNLDIAKMQLLLLMRMDTIDDFKIEIPSISGDQVTAIEATPSFIYYKALETMPEIKSAEIRLQGAQKNIASQKGRVSPSLSMRGSIGSGFSGKNIDPTTGETKPFNNQVSDNFNQSIGFALTIPIFNSLNTHAAVQRAKVNHDIRQNEIEQAKYQINETVKRAYYDARAAYKKYQANEKAVSAMRQSYQYSEKRYELGMMNAVEFNQSKTNLTQSEADLLQAKYDYIFKNMILDFYQGNPLTLRQQ